MKTYPLLNETSRHEVWKSGATFVTSALDEGEWTASRPRRFRPGERAPGTHWIGGWVGPTVDLDAVTRKIPNSCRESNPGRPARSLVAILTGLHSGTKLIIC
jgi:hypothetical protein